MPKGHFLRKLEQEILVNIAYRWFLGLDLEDKVPDHSVFSQNRRRRFKDTEVFREIFNTVIKRCAEAGLIGGECVVMDSTHIKANAANGHAEKVILMEGPNDYWLKLNDELSDLLLKAFMRYDLPSLSTDPW